MNLHDLVEEYATKITFLKQNKEKLTCNEEKKIRKELKLLEQYIESITSL